MRKWILNAKNQVKIDLAEEGFFDNKRHNVEKCPVKRPSGDTTDIPQSGHVDVVRERNGAGALVEKMPEMFPSGVGFRCQPRDFHGAPPFWTIIHQNRGFYKTAQRKSL